MWGVESGTPERVGEGAGERSRSIGPLRPNATRLLPTPSRCSMSTECVPIPFWSFSWPNGAFFKPIEVRVETLPKFFRQHTTRCAGGLLIFGPLAVHFAVVAAAQERQR